MINRSFKAFTDKFNLESGLQYWLLAAITLLAAALRFYKLGEWSFWIDEIYTINHAQAHFSSLELIRQHIPPYRNWIPLSVISTAGALNLWGVSEWSARFAAAAIGVLSIPALYFPIKRVLGVGVALTAVLLLAVAPWHIYWSQNARFLTALLLFYTLALFIFYLGLEQDRLRYFLLFIPLLYLAMSERMIALFLGPVIVCYVLALILLPIEKPQGFRRRSILILLALGLALVAYEVILFVTRGSSPLIDTLSTFVGTPIDSPIRLLILIVTNLTVPLVCLGFFSGVYLIARKNRLGLFLFISAVVPPLLLVLINPFVFTVDRYVFMTLPSWIILGAVAVKEIYARIPDQGKIMAVGVLSLLLADAGNAHLSYYWINHGNRPEWKTAFAYIERRKDPDDVIVSAVANVGSYYMDEEVMWLSDINPDAITADDQRYWFVIDSENGWWATEQKEWVEENSNFVEAWYLRTREDMHLRLYVYDPSHRVMGAP